MLFDQLPTPLIAFLMALSCAIKHTASSRLAQTRWFQELILGRGWYGSIVLLALAGGVGTYLIFDKFVGWPLAVELALIDAALFAFTGTVARRIKLFKMDRARFLRWVVGLRTVHVVAYGIYIWLALR